MAVVRMNGWEGASELLGGKAVYKGEKLTKVIICVTGRIEKGGKTNVVQNQQ